MAHPSYISRGSSYYATQSTTCILYFNPERFFEKDEEFGDAVERILERRCDENFRRRMSTNDSETNLRVNIHLNKQNCTSNSDYYLQEIRNRLKKRGPNAEESPNPKTFVNSVHKREPVLPRQLHQST
ncbi:unnamed protein product [Nesidiocoris tenuis]|uniref:Uncharacterized protein n=1 Tax=Nesidiocoris tenuis TaxID=355587 RepID=A0A6H5FU46_9HEMI|nr:unnamed protein product [Nesidiocoris tenuis]